MKKEPVDNNETTLDIEDVAKLAKFFDPLADSARADAEAPADFVGGEASPHHVRSLSTHSGHVGILCICHAWILIFRVRPSY